MNIELKEWTEETAPKRVPILNNPDVYRFLSPALPLPYTVEDSMKFLSFCREKGLHERAVVVDGEVVGSIGINPREDPQVAELGYYLAPSHHRRGIMGRVVPLYLQMVPEWMPVVVRVQAHVFDFNPASQALLRHCGFSLTDKVLIERARDGMDHRLLVFERPVSLSTGHSQSSSSGRTDYYDANNRSTGHSLNNGHGGTNFFDANNRPGQPIK